MVISWIMSSVSESIVKSIMFVDTAYAIWRQLEKRFALSNGSRKYKLHKETYSCEQNGQSKEEQHLFQFLNGLDEQFSALRSQMLLMSPLPSVEVACSMLQQEESQREMFTSVQSHEMTALYSKSSTGNNGENCNLCGNKGHSPDKCWVKIGYPPWHYKSRLSTKQSKGKSAKTHVPSYNATKKTAATAHGNNVVFTSE
ncbi:uncharacterized protein [Rutidosis leptorrhynchoides]|uniref:uncharacterized protein n=1 Tax=Rutidosis leptorrhynchoides TaxID=125765 RepID=UPI003A99AB22